MVLFAGSQTGSQTTKLETKIRGEESGGRVAKRGVGWGAE